MIIQLDRMPRLKKQLLASRTLGLGSGRAAADFVEALKGEKSLVRRLTAYPSSRQIQLVAAEAGLRIGSMEFIKEVDVVVDGADQIDSRRRIIKGGGGALLNEKILWEAAKSIFVIAGDEKFVRNLDMPVPVEVVPAAVELVRSRLSLEGGKATMRLLERGFPLLTERGNVILDVKFRSITDAEALERKVKNFAGVVEVGLFNFPDVSIYRIRDDATEEL
jgi:ribose 5-phosphate isomerase A